LKGQIVILDEAHNIEDSTRDAASFSVTQTKVNDALKDLHDISQFTVIYCVVECDLMEC
jgi:Fanconi anemia group J protein